MAKTATLFTRIEPDTKEHAEAILSALGISPSSAITMFYKQIILHNGLPFELKLAKRPLDMGELSADQLNAELEKGYRQIQEGKGIPASIAFENLRKKYDF